MCVRHPSPLSGSDNRVIRAVIGGERVTWHLSSSLIGQELNLAGVTVQGVALHKYSFMITVIAYLPFISSFGDKILCYTPAQLLASISLICKQIFCRSGDITDCAIRFMQANIIEIDT